MFLQKKGLLGQMKGGNKMGWVLHSVIMTMQADAVLGRSSRQRIMSFRHVLPNSAVPSRGTFRSEWCSAPSLGKTFGRGQC
jgi:hypothetical protein